METVLKGLQWTTCLIYLDDVIVHAKSIQEMTLRLTEVLNRFHTVGLKLKPSKCHFYYKQVQFLGHVISGNGVATDPEKIESVQNFPRPSSLSDIRSFLGLCSYYRRFIKDFSKIVTPLSKLTRKDTPFHWGSEEQCAMNTLKTKLTSAPILTYPIDSDSFILDCDACDFGIAGVISQIQDGVEKVIAYGSKTLSKAEGRYCVTRKELLAIVYFVKHYKHYLLGRHFLVRTDHQRLKWLFSLKEPTGQLACWLEFLQSSNFEVEYRPGSKHGNADGMSRIPCHPQQSMSFLNWWSSLWSISKCQRRSSNDLVKISAITTRRSSLDRPSDPVPWTGFYTSVQLTDFQLQDKQIAPVLLWKEELSERPPNLQLVLSDPETRFLWLSWDSLEIKEGVLYKQAILQPQRHIQQYIVPKNLRDEVLHSCHNMVLSGHLGEKKSLSKIIRFATWFRRRESIHIWIEKCVTCQANKRPKKHARALWIQLRLTE